MHPQSKECAKRIMLNIESAVMAGVKFRQSQLEIVVNEAIELALQEADKDRLRLDFIQEGHSILCLARGGGKFEFEIDGYQDAPVDGDLRCAIDREIFKVKGDKI